MALVNGKIFDASKAEVIYHDGAFSSRGVTLYRTEKGALIWFRWTQWQGERDIYTVVTKEEAVKLLNGSPHPIRAAEAIAELGIELEKI